MAYWLCGGESQRGLFWLISVYSRYVFVAAITSKYLKRNVSYEEKRRNKHENGRRRRLADQYNGMPVISVSESNDGETATA